jgi:flagellar biosynthesis GTPase FlhF
MTINYYEYIGLTQDATHKEIKDRCNRLLLDYKAITHGDLCFDEANETTRILIDIKQTLLDVEKRKSYDFTLSGVSYKVAYTPSHSMIRYCKDKNGERCAEEEGIALPECTGCPACTDPKVLKQRRETKATKEKEAREARKIKNEAREREMRENEARVAKEAIEREKEASKAKERAKERIKDEREIREREARENKAREAIEARRKERDRAENKIHEQNNHLTSVYPPVEKETTCIQSEKTQIIEKESIFKKIKKLIFRGSN